MKWFNCALLSKWVWRYLKDTNNLWARMITSRHRVISVDQGGLRVEGRRGGWEGWWKRMVAVVNGEGGRWFWGRLKKKVGNWRNTRLWDDVWVGDAPLKTSFPRIYHLCLDRNAMVGEAGRWEEERWIWEIGWRRTILDREKAVAANLLESLENVVLSENDEDEWWWEGATNGQYSVKKAYAELVKNQAAERDNPRACGGFNLVWKTHAPFKAQLKSY